MPGPAATRPFAPRCNRGKQIPRATPNRPHSGQLAACSPMAGSEIATLPVLNWLLARAGSQVRRAGAYAHRFSRVDRAVPYGCFADSFSARCPSGPGSRASHRAPASRVSALSGFDPYRGRPAGLTPVRRSPGCAVATRPRGQGGPRPAGGAGRRCEGAPRFRLVIFPCRPARRLPGAAGRRPR